MQGWRATQEDAHLVEFDIYNHRNKFLDSCRQTIETKNYEGVSTKRNRMEYNSLFGVFDGHGTEVVSNFVAKN